MLLSPASTSASLPSNSGFWNKFKPKNKELDLREMQGHMTVARQRLLTLAFGDMETIRMLPNTFAELDALARDWTKPPPDAVFGLRVPVEYASLHAARLVSGPYIYLTSEDSYQIAIMGVQGLRVEIVSDAPPPPDEPPSPPPPPILEMDAVFDLELMPGQRVALDTLVSSDALDMARMEDGTTVDGMFWGKLDIVHNGDTHKMEFSGTRLPPGQEYGSDFMFDSRVISKLVIAAKPTTAKCQLSILAPAVQYCDVMLTFSPFWKLGLTWPPAEDMGEGKVKYFLRAHPGGALEHFETQMVTTALYYEAIPDPSTMAEPRDYIAPRNGFAMPFRDFVPHLLRVLDQLGISLHSQTNFLNNNLHSFSQHKYIAYRFLPPTRIAAAIDITVTTDPCVFTRLFLIFRGLNEDDVGEFAGAGEKEANAANWREIIGWTEDSKDQSLFRILEVSVLEV